MKELIDCQPMPAGENEDEKLAFGRLSAGSLKNWREQAKYAWYWNQVITQKSLSGLKIGRWGNFRGLKMHFWGINAEMDPLHVEKRIVDPFLEETENSQVISRRRGIYILKSALFFSPQARFCASSGKN